MKQVPVYEENVLVAYKKAPQDTKSTLEDIFGKDFFNRKITDWVKTFEDACEIVGVKSNEPRFLHGESDSIAYEKLKVINKALNEGWKPNWNDSKPKWYPWFYMNNPGFRFNASTYATTVTHVGSRLCFHSEELSTYAAKQFLDLYSDYYTTPNDMQ